MSNSKKPDGKKKHVQKTKAEKPVVMKVKGPIPDFTPRKGPPDEILPILSAEDFIKGRFAAGRQISFGAGLIICEVNYEGGLTLLSTQSESLKPFVSIERNVFMKDYQLVWESFSPTLPGRSGEKQIEMWQHIGDALGDDGLDRLKSRLQAKKDEEKKRLMFVGENPEIWKNASLNVTTAFEQMTDIRPAEFRVGKTLEEGLVFGCFFDKTKGVVDILVGHVGNKNQLAGKILIDSVLMCWQGMLPDAISEEVTRKHPRAKSASEFLQYILLMGHTEKDQIIVGMLNAVERINKEAAKKKPPVLQLVQQKPAVAKKVEVPVAQTITPTPAAPASMSIPQSVLTAPASTNLGLSEALKAMREAGWPAEEVLAALRGNKDTKSA